MFMNILHAIILGIVEGITEFLPVSSTAHMEFAAHAMRIVQTDFVKSFLIVVQLGAILAVAILYRRRLLTSWKTWRNIVIGFIPTGILGFALYKLVKGFLLGNVWLAAAMLIVGGIVILIVESRTKERLHAEVATSIEDLSVGNMLLLGVIQAVAVVPGVSRSGALIVGGRLMHIPRKVIVEAAFLLALPTMAAAAGYDLLKTGIAFSGNEWWVLLVGTAVSCVVAYVAASWLISYVSRAGFKVFGWYRIVAGVVLLVAFFLGL